MQRLQFLLAFVLPPAAIYSFTCDGWHSLTALIIIFIVFPILELVLPLDSANLDEKMTADEKNASFYDWLLYAAIPVYLFTFVYFFAIISSVPSGSFEFWTNVITMGLICAIFGFNIGHELSHRKNKSIDYFLGQIQLLSVLNLHFIPYHIGGHHRNVGKPSDPSTALKGEWVYTFWFRSQIGGYFQAWQIENKRTEGRGHLVYSLDNKMVRYTLITFIYLIGLYFILDQSLFGLYLLVVFISTCFLETINYIEHYGLVRTQDEMGRYEPVQHHHSWNSDHIFGRALMFNLSRHSDHHYNGSLKYQVLKSLPDTPQMPTGYPGMVVLSFFPPLWFYVMNRRLEAVSPSR
jgi:alkane 1-monooxygenase